MSLRARLRELPAAYEVVEAARGVLAVHRDYRERLLAAGFRPDGDPVWTPSGLAGRRPLGAIELDGERLVVRRFHHGGLLRWLFDERFRRPERPFEELLLAHELTQRGIDTPLVIAARAWRAAPGWRLALCTRRVEEGIDASFALERVRTDPSFPPEARARLFGTVGEFVGRLHAAGLVHGDLTPRNLLLEERALTRGNGRVWILDLDRSELRATLSDEERCRILARLLRYVQRRQLPARAGGRWFGTGDVARFLRGYQRGLGREESRWRLDWRRIERHERRARLAHRVSWFLEELFGGGPETRDGRVPAGR